MSDISVISIQGRENSILSNESNISIGGFQPTLQISPHILAPTFGVDSNPQLLLEQLSHELTSSNAQLNTRVIQLIREAGFVSLWFYLKFIAGSAGPYNLLDEQLHLDMANFRQRVATTPGIKACGLVPRSCYKSTIWSHGPNAWELLRNPNLRIGCTSQVYDRALSFVQTTISIFTDNDLHKLLYPEYVKENRSNVDLVLANRTRKYPESNLQAISAGSSTQGSHFDLFDCDDIVGEDMLNASHVAGADMARMGNWLFSNLRTLVVSWIDSRVMVVGTRYAVDDPYERIMKSSKEHIGFWDAMEADYPLNPEGDWVTYYRPAVQTDKDGNNYSVNPNAFNLKQLAELELSDPWVYQSQYANNPLAAGVSDFANYTIERFELEWDDDKETYEIVFLDKAIGDFVRIDLRSCDVIVAGDPSGGTVVASYNSSRAAVVVLATDGLGRRFVLDVEANFVPPTKFFGWLFQYKKKYFNYCRGTFIEAQAAFKSFISILRKEEVLRGEWLNLVGINALGDKETTIRNIIQPLLDKGKLFLRHAVYVKVMEELRVFPSKKMDILDALKIAVYKSIVPRDKNYSIDDDDDDDRFHRKRSNRDHVNKTTGY